MADVELRGGVLTVAGLAVNQALGTLPVVCTHASRLRHLPPGSMAPAWMAPFAPPDHGLRLVPPGERISSFGEAQLRFEPGAGPAAAQLLLETPKWRIGIFTGAETGQSLECEVAVVDASYGLPVYRWPTDDQLAAELQSWWATAAGRVRVLVAEPTDELPRLLGLLGQDVPIFHAPGLAGIVATASISASPLPARGARKAALGGLVVAGLEELTHPTLPALGTTSLAIASGRMRIRGARRRLSADQGLVLSSRADWPELLRLCTARQKVLALGRHADALCQALREQGQEAEVLSEVKP